MPTTISEATIELLDYDQFLDYAANQLQYDGQTEMLLHISSKLNSNPYNISSSLTTREQWAEQIMRDLRDSGYEIQYNGNNQWTGSVFQTTPQVTTTNPVNSNISTVSRGNIRNWYGGLNEFDGNLQKWVPTRYPVSGGLGTKAMYVLGSIGSAISAASTGIWLGKTFDSALYNLMPDYWDSIGASSLNPETWASLTNGSDSPFAGMLNFILGIDGENGTAQAYMDQNQLAYMALLLKNAGWFSSGELEYTIDTTEYSSWPSSITVPIPITYNGIAVGSSGYTITYNITNLPSGWIPVMYRASNGLGIAGYLFHIGEATLDNTRIGYYTYSEESGTQHNSNASNRSVTTTYNGTTFTRYTISSAAFTTFGNLVSTNVYDTVIQSSGTPNPIRAVGTVLFDGTEIQPSTIPGVGNQTGATLPDVSTWNDIPSTLQSLQNQ